MSINQIALDNLERNIDANYHALGIHPSPDEIEQIYAICLRIAERERDGEYGTEYKK